MWHCCWTSCLCPHLTQGVLTHMSERRGSLRECGLLANVSTCGATSGHPQFLILIPLPTTSSLRMSSQALSMSPSNLPKHIQYASCCPIVLRTSRTRLGSQTSQHGTMDLKEVITSKQMWTCVNMMSLE
ncbi:hypothetical protein EDB86DRAFT_2973743 [Lactarius hatsudake]|nr:hypothetical protein EDB86DRAFT_2973743 [Lactarius hatsudake]